MQISLSGIGSETLLSDFESAGIEFTRINADIGSPMAGGDKIQIIKDVSGAIPWGTISTVLIAWLKFRPSRKAVVTTKDQKVIHLEGFSAKETERLLPLCLNIIAAETKKPNE